MSKEVKTKEKVNMDPKYILTLTVTLLVTCVIVAGLLGLVNQVTAPNIAKINQEKTEAALAAVVADPESAFPPVEVTEEMAGAAKAGGGTLNEAYEVQSAGACVGYAFKITASGSQGDIVMMVGVDADGVVTGVSIVSNKETAGIGSKVMNNENGVLDQFQGKSSADGALTVGSNVDAISGATVSTRGVTAGVNAALAVSNVMG